MATLPRSIQAQVEAANALMAQPHEQPVAPPETSVAEPPAADVQSNEPPVQESVQAPAQPQADVWESRYKSLQGIFEKEVPRLQGQVKDLSGKYQQAVEQLEKLAKQAETQVTKPETGADPRDVENFGSDLVDMVRRVAQQMLGGVGTKVDSVVQGFEKRLAAVEHQLQGTSQAVAVTAEQSFYDRLAKLVPDWESVNQEQPFLTWLGEVDPVYGQPRQGALNQARDALNADRAAAVFNAYKSLKPKAPAKTPLDKQVSPRVVASSAPQAQVAKTTLTEAQIVQYYAAKRRGEYTPAQVVEFDQMINDAIAEGRVR